MIQDLHCTELQASLGLGLYAMGYGVVPLICSSFSEVLIYQFDVILEH